MKPRFNQLAIHYFVLGLLVCAAAVSVMILVRMESTWVTGNVGVLFGLTILCLAAGLGFIAQGAQRYFRAANVLEAAEPLVATQKGPSAAVYKKDQIRSLLDVKRPILWVSENLVDRWLLHLCPMLDYASPVLQQQARIHFRRAFGVAVGMVGYLVLALSVFLGVLRNADSTLGWSATVYFFLGSILAFRAPDVSRKMAWIFAVAMAIPWGVQFISRHFALPPVPESAITLMLLSFALPILVFVVFFLYLRTRLASLHPEYDSSAMAFRVQHTLRPAALIQYAGIAMDQLREDSLPNRLYYSALAGQADFAGEQLWETHPQLQSYAGLNTSAAAWCAVPLCLSGFVTLLVHLGHQQLDVLTIILSLLLIVYGRRLLLTAELFTLECFFASKLVWLHFAGTSGQATIASGNHLVGKVHVASTQGTIDANMKVIVANAVTSVFAGAGEARPFLQKPRFVVTLRRNDELLEALVGQLQQMTVDKINVSEARVAKTNGDGPSDAMFKRMSAPGNSGRAQLPTGDAGQ